MLRRILLLPAALLLAVALPGLAAQTKAKPAKAAAPAPTNVPPALVEIPKSVFDVPANPQEGKDPFFPLSTRLFASPVAKTNGQAAPKLVVDLKLKGFSGTADHPLAIINNRTFGIDEEGSVSTAAGRVTIRCVEIKPDSVVVQVGGQQRILHLRQGS